MTQTARALWPTRDGMAPFAAARKAPAGITLHWCNLDDDATILLAEAEATLSAAEAERARRFHFVRDRARYTRGRGFLRRVLAQATGGLPRDMPLRMAAHGKPLLDLPGAPGFNLSHAGLAVLALRANGAVGIDLERCDRQLDAAALLDTCLTPQEAAHLRALPQARLAGAFLACWTAKEAVIKLTGEGLTRDPRMISLTLEQGVPRASLTPPARLIAVPVAGHACHIALPEHAPNTEHAA